MDGAVVRLRDGGFGTACCFFGPFILAGDDCFAKRLESFLPDGAKSFVRSVLFLQPRRPLGGEFRLEFRRKLLQIVTKIRDHRVFVVQFDAHDAGCVCVTNSRGCIYASKQLVGVVFLIFDVRRIPAVQNLAHAEGLNTAWLIRIRPCHVEIDVDPNALLDAVCDELVQFFEILFADFADLGILPDGGIVPVRVHEMEAKAVEAVLAEAFGEFLAVFRLRKAGVARQIRAEKAQRHIAVIDEMAVFRADKSMGTSRFWRQETDIDWRARRRFKAWNFKGGPAGRLRRDLRADGKAYQQGDGVQILHGRSSFCCND